MKEVTLLTVNWQTRNCLELMLKSYVLHHYTGEKLKILLWDNNSQDDSKDFLRSNGIPFFQSETNLGHENALNVMFSAITTKYVLLVDTDILFNGNVYHYFDKLTGNVVAAGDLIRGDKLHETQIKPRLGAWAIFFDIERLKEIGMKTFRTKSDCALDVCGELYEHIWMNNLDVHIIPRLPGNIDVDLEGMKYLDFSHFGKLSWDLTKHSDRTDEVNRRRAYVDLRLNEFKDVDLKNKFIL